MIEIGTMFRSQSEGAYGRPSRTIWKVIAISDATSRYAHASLADTADVSSTKLVAVSALNDPVHYRPVE
jgi:hypothetical protein